MTIVFIYDVFVTCVGDRWELEGATRSMRGPENLADAFLTMFGRPKSPRERSSGEAVAGPGRV